MEEIHKANWYVKKMNDEAHKHVVARLNKHKD